MDARLRRPWRALAAAALALLLAACAGSDDGASKTPASDGAASGAANAAEASAAAAAIEAADPAAPALRAPAERAGLDGLVLVVRGGAFEGGRLQLDVAVENSGASAISVPRLGGADLRLEGPDGSTSAPLEVRPSLERIG